MSEPKLVVKEMMDSEQLAKAKAQHERCLRNCTWLADHWGDLLPGARGRHVAVAGQEAFVADTAVEALARAKTAHPDDDGTIVQYVRPDTNPRFYANRRPLVPV